ncbi:MAG: NAD(P)-binding protein [Halieaceae bacterium]|jgi:spermidine dehydrogenase|nr:NAD(P)-binding protein [Halieaceae bacterium]
MSPSDRELGMHRRISRRDLLHGVGALTAGAILPPALGAGQAFTPRGGSVPSPADIYPPALGGLRGNHVGSFEVAHQLGRQGRRDWGAVQDSDGVLYDLVVVGAGISGLAAAHFYRKRYPQAQVLIVDNHDDFGGHAKRNEFQLGGRTLVGYGGAQTLEEPSGYSAVVKGLLKDLGVDTKKFNKAYDRDFLRRHGLGAGVHFNREKWGSDRVVPIDLGVFEGYLPVAPSPLSIQQAVQKMPISKAAKRELKRLLLTDEDQMPEISGAKKWRYLYSISYRDFLSKHLGIREPEVFALLQDLAADSGVGIESATALSAIGYNGLPGWDAAGLPGGEEDEPYIHHFPDGNASIARLLVRRLIPTVAGGNTMEDVVLAKFDYAKLDLETSSVRLRLNSTVTRVAHEGDLRSAAKVHVSYVRGGRAFRVQARNCVLACNNSIIPHLCPELPKAQREALAFQVKIPILYTNVALRNWQAWKRLGIGAVVAPGSYHINAALDFPVSLGGYAFSGGPDEPAVVHMERFPHRSNEGLTAREQYRLGRQELLSTSFETIERHVRVQLSSMLQEGGFDPARDIQGITVNRWAHGYAYWYNPLFDTVYEDDDDPRYPHMKARKPYGRIAIANADAAANAMFEAAVEQGHRAATELD